MAGMIYNYLENPRYQRLIQRLSSMRPEQRAIFNTAMVDRAFGNEAMQKHLQALALQADTKHKQDLIGLGEKSLALGERRLGLSKKQFDVRTGLTREKRDFADKQGRLGTYMAAANIPIAGYFGAKQMQRDFDEAEAMKAFRKKWYDSVGGKS